MRLEHSSQCGKTEELKKLRKFPIKAKPSAPIKTAIALEVNTPARTLVATDTVFNEAALFNTLLFMYFVNLPNQ